MLALTASIFALACDKSPLFAPTQSSVTPAASRLVLPIEGVAEIIASVIEQAGTAVQNGTLVTFTTTLGTIEPREARTHGGKVTVRLHAGTQSGTATVGAFSGDATAETLEILVGGAAAGDITVTAKPGTVSAKGGSVEIIAFVTDESGNRLSGVPVTFTASAGTLSSTSRVTNASGEARVTLRTNQKTTVTVTAGGQEETVIVEVTNAPTVSITAGTDPTEDQPTDFTVIVAAGSSPIRTVTIDFGDAQAQALGALDGTATVSHVYRTAGTFVVTVTATDSVGESTTVTTTVTVAAATAPTVTISTTTTSPTADLPTTFSITVTANTNPIRRVSVDFGDGRTQSLGATTGTTAVSHVYTSAGTFTVTVTACDTQGVTGTAATVVTVEAATPPTVTISASPSTVAADEVITFTITITEETNPIKRVFVDFGDGRSQSVGTGTTSVSHVYTSDGTFAVTVTATDTQGLTGSATIVVVVTEPTPLSVTLAASTPTTAPVSITFTATVTPATAAISRYEWSFGDGGSTTTTGNVTTHVYEDDGTFTITVDVVAADGREGSATIQLIIP